MSGQGASRAAGTNAPLALEAPRAWIYASFAASRAGGNPAGVVVSAQPISTGAAQSLAAVLSVPTTGFVVADLAAAEGTVSVRFFTPQQEIAACGHVTIAIATALVELGIWSWGREVTVRSPGGEFPLHLRDGQVEMDQRQQFAARAAATWGDITAALGDVRAHSDLPLEVSGTGLRHLIVPVADLAALSELTLDGARIAALTVRAQVDTICVWAATLEADRFRVRDLCAGIGALEEPASGTTAGALALYLARHDQLDRPKLDIEQGVEMGRPSRLEVIVTAHDAVTIRGTARKVLAGELELRSGDA
jgi:PhzF family phenazine biosynthesis protein